MKTMKSDFEKIIEELEVKSIISHDQEKIVSVIDKKNREQIFNDLEISLQEYRRDSQIKQQQSEKELMNIFLI